jgi:hypothetical protein
LIPIIAFVFWLCLGSAWADSKSAADSGGPFKLSFLELEPSLEDTCQMLTKSGFPDATVTIFKKLVRFHNKDGNRVDRAKFPQAHDGYYEFQSFADFTNRLQCSLGRTPATNALKDYTLTCFDVTCLLLHDAGYGVPALKQDFESKGIVLLGTHDLSASVSYEEWYRGCRRLLPPEKAYEFLTGRTRSESEGLLNLSFRTARRVNDAGPHCEEIFSKSFPVFVGGLQRSGFVFPANFQMGFVFFVRPFRNYVWADHVFLCFPHYGKLICLEKFGSRDPYVRAEFGCAEDLGRFVSWDELCDADIPGSSERETSTAVSLNDRWIGLWSRK